MRRARETLSGGPLFDLRKVTADDKNFHEYVDWLADLQKEVTHSLLEEKAKESRWDVKRLNRQLYGVLSETAQGKLKDTVMSRERERARRMGPVDSGIWLVTTWTHRRLV